MFNFFKKPKAPECTKSVEETAAFFKADSEARKAAGLEGIPGEYNFICPNCGSSCKGIWYYATSSKDSLHGQTDCFTCNIHLRA